MYTLEQFEQMIIVLLFVDISVVYDIIFLDDMRLLKDLTFKINLQYKSKAFSRSQNLGLGNRFVKLTDCHWSILKMYPS